MSAARHIYYSEERANWSSWCRNNSHLDCGGKRRAGKFLPCECKCHTVDA